jgi:hypothetical protein
MERAASIGKVEGSNPSGGTFNMKNSQNVSPLPVSMFGKERQEPFCIFGTDIRLGLNSP